MVEKANGTGGRATGAAAPSGESRQRCSEATISAILGGEL